MNSALILLMLLTAQPRRIHPVDEICNVMGVPQKPCPIEVYSLLYTPHEHAPNGDLIIMTKGPNSEMVRTTVDRVKWLSEKRALIEKRKQLQKEKK